MNEQSLSRDRGGRYRRDRSPPMKGVYTGPGDDMEAQSPSLDMAVQDPMLAHSVQQTRGGLPSQQDQIPGHRNRYPPPTGAIVGSRGCPPPAPGQQQPPTYPGPPATDPGFEEGSGAKGGATPPRRRAARHTRRLSGASDAGGMSTEPGTRPMHSPSRGPDPNLMSSDQRPRESRSLHHSSSPGRRLAEPASSPGRVSSPSINQSVLHPLETKMREYYEHMEEEQKRMRQLDEEMRALQDQRQQAEERFIDAKAKHDEYERQHMDVERALRGDLPPRQQPQQVPLPPQPVAPSPSWTMTRAPSMDSFDDRPASGRSGGPNPKGRSRFRLSLFRS